MKLSYSVIKSQVPLFTRQKETRVSFRPGEPGLGMDHLIFDVGGGGGGGWENPKKIIRQAHPPGKKNLAKRRIFGKKIEHMKLSRRSIFLSKWI